MHIFWEDHNWAGGVIDQQITWLSWYGFSDRPNLGYLGAGSQLGSVGIALTNLKKANRSNNIFGHINAANNGSYRRLNYNLRGHRNAINIVEWNKHHKKLASCDESGVCYVWICYEDRWSVELVNDRNVKINCFVWSPNGELALICYSDNFVLVGSVNGQRLWSSNMENSSILCGTWNPDDTQVVLATSDGELLVLNMQGNIITRHFVWKDHPIEKLSWSAARLSDMRSTLCVIFRNGVIYFMRSVDDADPVVVKIFQDVVRCQWNETGEFIAIASICNTNCTNFLSVYDDIGNLLVSVKIPSTSQKAVSSLCWGYSDKCLFVAVQNELLCARIHRAIPQLQMLSSYRTWKSLRCASDLIVLPLPDAVRKIVEQHGSHIVHCQVPDCFGSKYDTLIDSLSLPCGGRWYCTMVPEPQLSSHLTTTYKLCVEHLGGLIPVLRGRQINRFRPEFEIRLASAVFDTASKKLISNGNIIAPVDHNANICAARERSEPPEHRQNQALSTDQQPILLRARTLSCPDSFQRDSVWRRSKRQIQQIVQRAHAQFTAKQKERHLVTVTSNLWCTRFKICGINETGHFPSYLGQVVYKTSVLHLQPRVMTVNLVDLRNVKSTQLMSNHLQVPTDDDPADMIGTCCVDDNLLERALEDGPPVAPFPAEIFSLGAPNMADINLSEDFQSPSTSDAQPHELAYYEQVEQRVLTGIMREFDDLKTAVDRHMVRMRQFVTHISGSNALELDKQHLNNSLSATQRSKNVTKITDTSSLTNSHDSLASCYASTASTTMPSDICACSCAQHSANINTFCECCESHSCTAENFTKEIERMQFIDEDSSSMTLLQNAETEGVEPCDKANLKQGCSVLSEKLVHNCVYTAGTAPARTRNKQLREIVLVLDKLSKLVGEVTSGPSLKRASDNGSTISGDVCVATGSKITPQRLLPALSMTSSRQCRPNSDLCNRLNDLSLRVAQLESRINYGSELLEDIRKDLINRVVSIRRTLTGISGEAKLNNSSTSIADSSLTASGYQVHDAVTAQPGCSIYESPEILTLHNKAPFWNEASQVYQLDFGGRVTQESAKNFQIEYQGKQVMQFGRIESNSFTLDFQEPFSAVQAFSVALASITQRLK